MANFITEAVSSFFKKPKKEELSSEPRPDDIIADLDDIVPTGFYDSYDGSLFNQTTGKKQKTIKEQNQIINSYRRIADTPEVSIAIDEIIDEAIFSPGTDDIISLDFGSDISTGLQEKLVKEFQEITNSINLNKNMYSMFRSFYVDGQLNVHCSYKNNDTSAGIQSIKILSPLGLQFNRSTNKWEYLEPGYSMTGETGINKKNVSFDIEELIRIDSGIYSDNLILGNLHQAIKPSNMLSTLEDMLIPMRFTRSVSRRVFNLDVSKLNPKKAEEAMNENRRKFKYKKFYNLEDGTISNQQHVAALTEDYWFPNRGGEKGTTVDTLDETGNLGELGDVLYFKRKLYTALKVPVDRINDEGIGDGSFDYDTSSITREELKFFNFVSRLRNQFLELFVELLKRNVISKKIMSEDEWDEYSKSFNLKFSSENKFFEKMERETISENLSLFNDIEELIGKYVSYNYVFKTVLKLNDKEIIDMMKEIKDEKNDPKFSTFFGSDEDSEEEKW